MERVGDAGDGKFGSIDDTIPEMESLQGYELSGRVRPVVREYERLDLARDRFLWKWLRSLTPSFTLPSVEPGAEARVADVKVVGSVFTTIMDDLVEKAGDVTTFEEVAKIPFDAHSAEASAAGVRDEYVRVGRTVWEAFESTLSDGPCYEDYRRWLRYDVEQVTDAVRYSGLVNTRPEGINYTENRRFDAYNMMMFVYADVDLTYSPAFDPAELGTLREVVDRAQMMARIGNWLSTWERELAEGDFTSGVLSKAVESGVVTPQTLESVEGSSERRREVVGEIRAAELEAELKRDWFRYRRMAGELADDLESVDLDAYVAGMDTVLQYHLASEGLK